MFPNYLPKLSSFETVILSEDCSLRPKRKEQPQSKDPYQLLVSRPVRYHTRNYFLGKFGSFLISRICWICRSACVEISSIHCQQSMTCPYSPKL